MARRRITPREHRVVPWRNGLGMTAEIAQSQARRPDGEPVWRVSLARMGGPAAFSDWPGWLRVLTVVEGAGLALDFPDGSRRVVAPLAPCRFAGAPAPFGTPMRGAVANLNLIAAEGVAARVVTLRLTGARTLRARDGLLYVVSGRLMAGGLRLRRGDALRVAGAAPLGGSARVVWMTF